MTDLRGSVNMTHGGGGRATARLIRDVFQRRLDNPYLAQGHDATRIDAGSGRLAVTTDTHVVSPLFFPGGDIGSLAVHGTLNDVAMAGARPIALTAGFVIEEGYPLADLDRIAASMGEAAREAGVPVVAGDTKVVERGKGDGVYINTTGVGVVPDGVDVGPHRLGAGQVVLLSGCVGDHGVAVLSKRKGLEFGTEILSDSAPLHRMVAEMIARVPDIAVLRDPTRGGLAATLNELADAGRVGMILDERAVPIRPGVRAACEILGLDPLNVANEGKLICVCAEAEAETLLSVMRSHPEGREAARIGTTTAETPGLVRMVTEIGGTRVVDWLSGEQLPRIC